VAQILDLYGEYAIEQGVPYSLTLRYPGNVASAVFTMKVRKSPRSTALINATATSATFDSGTGKTTIVFSLTAAVTGGLPNQNLQALERWVYDVQGKNGSADPFRVCQGKVALNPQVSHAGA
jgi:hypothetical protein